MAPELYLKKAYNQSVDVFAFGTLLWEIFAREVPFDGQEAADIMQKIQVDDSLANRPGAIPPEVYQIVRDCRKVNSA